MSTSTRPRPMPSSVSTASTIGLCSRSRMMASGSAAASRPHRIRRGHPGNERAADATRRRADLIDAQARDTPEGGRSDQAPTNLRSGLELHEVVARGVQRQIGGRFRADLAHRRQAMGFDRLDADAEQLGDRVIGIAFGDELDDLPFARREPPFVAIDLRLARLRTGRCANRYRAGAGRACGALPSAVPRCRP